MAAANRAAEGSHQDASFRTINDPRTASTSDLSRTGSTSSKPGDANDEMTVLSDKLVSAIEHNSSLEEKVAETRRELEASRERIAKLEAEAKEYEQKRSKGGFITTEDAEAIKRKANAEVEEERKQKLAILQEKRGIETELETLTSSLFEEANKMVASANQQKALVEKKNQQLRDQIKDGEALLASQTEQLAELKVLMQQINTDHRKDLDSPRVSLPPQSPGVNRADSDLARLLEAMNLSPVTGDTDIPPSPSTALTHLIRPSIRTDIPAYEDFKNLIANSHPRSHTPSHAPSRAGSGSYSGLAAGLGLLPNNSNPNLANSMKSDPATSRLAQAPHVPGQFSPNPDSKGPIALKDTRFIKRLIAEDVEPTLRLDLSPTISWLNRRSILSALTDSTLIVEPIPEASQRLYGKYTSCALCGDARKAGENPRTHAMRVREGEGATKWSICTLCLEKVRGVCDLIAYVRMIREGIVKCGDRKEEEEAWEELVRMRERLFWARMAGGVVPAFLPSIKNSPVVKTDGATPSETKDGTGSNFQTPNQSRKNSDEEVPKVNIDGRRDSDEETKSERDAREQLERGLAEATTFDNMHEKITSPVVSPPGTPSRGVKRESGGRFPGINIPRIPDSFWAGQVNTLR